MQSNCIHLQLMALTFLKYVEMNPYHIIYQLIVLDGC
ncbi:hypothetical protein HmCmsJML078_03572 [Escherichia coli]|nr:hypothetical protein HmCmsJML078_03572 [Escherichia coli]